MAKDFITVFHEAKSYFELNRNSISAGNIKKILSSYKKQLDKSDHAVFQKEMELFLSKWILTK